MNIHIEGRFIFGITAIIENLEDEILLLKRSENAKWPNIWAIISGRKEVLEDPFKTLFREIEKETGLTNIEVIKTIDVFNWYFESQLLELIGVSFWCKTNINSIILSEEHIEFKWLKPLEALDISGHPIFKQNILQFIREKKRLGTVVG